MHDKIALILRGPISTDRGFPLWKKGALATAAALSLLGAHPNAHALALGAVQVKSALGEPLSAEVEVPDITTEEAASFQAVLGTPQEFQAAGADYSQALRGTRITLNRRPNGQAYLRVEGQQPVSEPFLTLVIDASWAKGHVVRDYTLLIDPPRPQAAASAAPPARQESAPVVTSAPRRQPDYSSRSVFQSAAAPIPSSAPGEEKQVRVQPGDTATAIVSAHPVEGVSLDQMLVAMLHTNQHAFIHGNVNLIRAGAVINMPSADQATAVSPASAHRMVIAQSRDFHAYRQGLAVAASRGNRTTAGRRSATGSVQSQVQETGAAPPPPDRLTLSRSQPANQATGPAGSAETHVAQSRHAQEQATREAELRRNINDLSQLAGTGGNPSAAPASAAKPSASAPNSPAASAAIASAKPSGAGTPAAQRTNSAPAASAPATAASTTAAASRAALRRPAAVPPPQPSFMDTLLDNWTTIGGILALILLLGGYGLYRSKRNRIKSNETALNSDLLSDGKRTADSYFGASGGQRVDTNDGGGSTDINSSMAYSPSQLEAVGDVDPVSEADVYLAYGRDAQAEEILKEALRTYPGRTPIYLKLAEIYAKQRDTRQLETIATEARRVTHGEGRDWQAIVNLGRELDPGNALYAADNVPVVKTPVAPRPYAADADEDTQDLDESPDSQHSLDLDLTDNNARFASPASQTPHGQFSPHASVNYAATMPASLPLSMAGTEPLPLTAEHDSTAPAPLYAGDIDFTPPAPSQAPPTAGMMPFDAGALAAGAPAHLAQTDFKPGDEDPLATKLALAQEFHAIGDSSSARALVKEVLAEATGALRTKAQQLLGDLG